MFARGLVRVGFSVLVLTWGVAGLGQVNVTTFHNDNARTGQNIRETILTTSNVNATTFGKLFSQSIDGYAYAQPLYVSNVILPNKGTHNVVYVATMNDSVYAFDADSNTGSNADPLWKVNFTDPTKGITTVPTSDVNCTDTIVPVGILSTPVIDGTSKTIYVLARTLENGTYYHRLHALDITTGAEKFGGPVAIAASVAGTGSGSVGGLISFDPKLESQRAALLLQNGLVYIGWSSLCDYSKYHGWLMAYHALTLEQTGVWLTTANGSKGGIWATGAGPAGDAFSNVFVPIGNGTFDVNTGGIDYGQSVVKLGPPDNGVFPIKDYFTPYNFSAYNTTDLDIGSSGLVLLPDQTGPHRHLLVQGDKAGNLFLINRDNMGRFNASSNSQIVQYIAAASLGMWSSPAWWNYHVYLNGSGLGSGDSLKAFSFNPAAGILSITASSKTSEHFTYPGMTVSISSNGTSNGIVWALNNAQFANPEGQGSLHAYLATDLSTQLYSSKTNGTRDNPGPPVKFTVPTIANGKVYITTQTSLVVYGLLE
jgi:PQQ-like domain